MGNLNFYFLSRVIFIGMNEVSIGDIKALITKVLLLNTKDLEFEHAVRATINFFAKMYPGNAVELRVPPFRVVQVLEGVTHRRGTPPAVVEMTPEIWIQLIGKKITWIEALENGFIQASGEQSDLARIISDF